MRQTFKTKIFNRILVLLGFASTTSCEYINVTKCEYGTPTMDFEISGKVVNQDSAPITGIKVSCPHNWVPGASNVFTAEDGSFVISGSGIVPVLEFKDVDGPENGGEFADKIQEIKVTKIKEGDGSWYMGKYEAKGVVIEMEEK